jgi:hypothetical protein
MSNVLCVCLKKKATSKKAWVETPPQVDMVNATGLQKNTLAIVQSGKHGGDFARCNKQACKHGVASSKCTWNAGQCGDTGQWNSCQVSQCPNWKVRLSLGHKGLANCCAPCGRARSNICELAWGEGGGVCDQGLC